MSLFSHQTNGLGLCVLPLNCHFPTLPSSSPPIPSPDPRPKYLYGRHVYRCVSGEPSNPVSFYVSGHFHRSPRTPTSGVNHHGFWASLILWGHPVCCPPRPPSSPESQGRRVLELRPRKREATSVTSSFCLPISEKTWAQPIQAGPPKV